AEDGIRDRNVTGVQTCALPISPALSDPPTVRDTVDARHHRRAASNIAVTPRDVDFVGTGDRSAPATTSSSSTGACAHFTVRWPRIPAMSGQLLTGLR